MSPGDCSACGAFTASSIDVVGISAQISEEGRVDDEDDESSASEDY